MQGCCADKKCTPETCMNLPMGITCGDCSHIGRCKAIFGHAETDTVCDWFPRRFLAAHPDAAGKEGLIKTGQCNKLLDDYQRLEAERDRLKDLLEDVAHPEEAPHE